MDVRDVLVDRDYCDVCDGLDTMTSMISMLALHTVTYVTFMMALTDSDICNALITCVVRDARASFEVIYFISMMFLTQVALCECQRLAQNCRSV